MTRRGVMGAAGAGLGLLLGGCGGLFGTWARLRYRLTVTCDTPDGEKTASAVQEIRAYDPIQPLRPVNNGSRQVIGDAIVMVVAGRPYFIGLNMCSQLVADAMQIGTVIPPSNLRNGFLAETIQRFADAKAQAAMDGVYRTSLPGRYLGVDTLADPQRFETLETLQVDSLNPVWRLKSVLVQTTDVDVTRQAIDALPWLKSISREQLQQSRGEYGYLVKGIADLSDMAGERL